MDKIKYGRYVICKSLGYIRREDFNGLKDKISQKVSQKFGSGLTDIDLESILKSAAQNLEDSWFFIWRWDDAKKLYEHLGLKEKAQRLDKVMEECIRNYKETYLTDSHQGIF